MVGNDQGEREGINFGGIVGWREPVTEHGSPAYDGGSSVFAQKLREKRLERGLKISDVARLLKKVGMGSLSRFERGVAMPDAEKLAVLSEWMGLPMDYFSDTRSGAQVSVPDAVEQLLRCDWRLDPFVAGRLALVFRFLYELALEGGSTGARDGAKKQIDLSSAEQEVARQG